MFFSKKPTNEWITPRRAARVAIVLAIFGASSAIASGGAGQEPRKAGKGETLVTMSKGGDVPLRSRLTLLCRTYDLSYFLDRQVDPEQSLEISAVDVPVSRVLPVVADKFKLGDCLVGKVHYLGPKGTTSRLPGIIAQRKRDAGKLAAKAAWSKAKPLAWDKAAMPRDISAGLVQEAGMTLENAGAIPHDVWPACSLPLLTLTERLSLVLAGFNLTYEFTDSGSGVKIVSMPAEAAYAEVYTLPADGANIAAQVQRIFPQLKMERAGSRLTVTATHEEHAQIDELLRTGKTTTVTTVPAQNKFSLTVDKKAAGAVVNTVCKTLGKEFKYDPALRDKLKESVSFTVKDVSADELLEKTLKPLGLSYKITDEAIEVTELP